MGLLLHLLSLTWLQATLLFALLYTFYQLAIVIYRLAFHPLAKFPGPKIAAATDLYGAAWDFFGKGAYIFRCEEMHRIYGPIVRISPDALLIKDPDYFSTVYVGGKVRRTNGWRKFANGAELDGSHVVTVDHDLHRIRRKPVETFFSQGGVLLNEGHLHEVIKTLTRRLRDYSDTGHVVRLDHALFAMAGDVMSGIAVGDHSMTLLRDAEFSPHWYQLFHTISRSSPLFVAFPWVIKVLRWLPEEWLYSLDAGSQAFRSWRIMAEKHIKEIQERGAASGITLFDHLLQSELPQKERTLQRLASEAQILLAAGTSTTARSICHLVVHIMLQPEIQDRLREELREPMQEYPISCPSSTILLQLPFLQACIKEGLRMSYATMDPLPRCAPDEGLIYNDWVIPKNTPVGMPIYFMHNDPSVFEEPFTFRPDRWLGNVSPEMVRNYVPFSRGSRNCVGMNLVNAEISLTLAALFCPQGPKLTLHQSDHRDVDLKHGYIIPTPDLNSKGVWVVVQ